MTAWMSQMHARITSEHLLNAATLMYNLYKPSGSCSEPGHSIPELRKTVTACLHIKLHAMRMLMSIDP